MCPLLSTCFTEGLCPRSPPTSPTPTSSSLTGSRAGRPRVRPPTPRSSLRTWRMWPRPRTTTTSRMCEQDQIIKQRETTEVVSVFLMSCKAPPSPWLLLVLNMGLSFRFAWFFQAKVWLCCYCHDIKLNKQKRLQKTFLKIQIQCWKYLNSLHLNVLDGLSRKFHNLIFFSLQLI